MKKLIIAMMILCLAVTSVFAIDGLKVGAEIGCTKWGMTMKVDPAVQSLSANGFTFSGVATYQVAENVDAVARMGFNTHGKLHESLTSGSVTRKITHKETMPTHFTAYVGGRYTYTINDQFSAYAGLGLDLMIGKIVRNDEKTSAFFGLNTELAGQYKIDDKFTANLGGTFTWLFADTSEILKDLRNDVRAEGGSWFEYRLGVTAGVTYSL